MIMNYLMQAHILLEPFYPFIALIWMHWFADFFCQTDKMAVNKSSSNKWLGIHVAVYSIPFLYFGIAYAIINGIAHFCTDYVTSRMSKKRWEAGKVHNFFVVVGFDQAIHLTTLFLTYIWLVM
ncbi:MAG: DUF3307 domain-containing protein [Candidatus Peribacteraceae bacterium]|nr:DUF3307 domain-containing protein [Candidatus Peribacteraceae bacterium]